KSDLEDSVKSVEKEQENLKDKKASYVKEGNDIEALEEKVNAIKQAKEEKEANQESGKQEAEKDTQAEPQEKDVKIEKTSTKNSKKNTNNEKKKEIKKKKKKKTNKKAETKTKTETNKEKKTTSKSKTNSNSTKKNESNAPKKDKKPNKKSNKEPSNDSIKEITMSATGYTAKCTGCSGITATGIDLNKNPTAKVVAVDPSVIPLGSRVWVSGYGEAIAGDTGGAIKGNRIDLHFPSKDAAYAFGNGTVTVKGR